MRPPSNSTSMPGTAPHDTVIELRCDAEWLRRRYLDDGASIKEIGRELGVTGWTVERTLARFGIARSRGGPTRVRATR